jgi:hypothetical protein
MRRHRLSLLAVAGVITALACSETSVGPRPPASRLTPRVGLDRVFPVTANADAPEVYQFDISPDGGTIALGDRFTLTLPASAVCDPSSSSYGAGHWDEDCTPTDRSITVNAKIWVKDNRVIVDFSPALRFAPSAVVTLSTNLFAPVLAGRVDLAATPRALSQYELLYSPDEGRTNIHEVSALADQSLKTYINLITGIVSRRVKHFSGYVGTFGEPCVPAYEGDPTCVWSEDGGGVEIEQIEQ